jgi:uncharacterized tellurite resistance protein B-like protein
MRMFETLKTYIAQLTGEPAREGRFSDDDYRLAAAALLVRVAAADGGMSGEKRANLHSVLKGGFDLDDAITARLIDEASHAEQRAVDLYHFTSRITRSVDDDGRRRIVEMMWEVVHAGERVGDFEQNFVWRAADLLGVSSRERIELRRRIAARAAHNHVVTATGATVAATASI